MESEQLLCQITISELRLTPCRFLMCFSYFKAKVWTINNCIYQVATHIDIAFNQTHSKLTSQLQATEQLLYELNSAHRIAKDALCLPLENRSYQTGSEGNAWQLPCIFYDLTRQVQQQSRAKARVEWSTWHFSIPKTIQRTQSGRFHWLPSKSQYILHTL